MTSTKNETSTTPAGRKPRAPRKPRTTQPRTTQPQKEQIMESIEQVTEQVEVEVVEAPVEPTEPTVEPAAEPTAEVEVAETKTKAQRAPRVKKEAVVVPLPEEKWIDGVTVWSEYAERNPRAEGEAKSAWEDRLYTMVLLARVEAIKAHALANYEKDGWDIVVETMTDDDLMTVARKSRSTSGAIKRLAEMVKPVDEVRAEIVSA